MSNTKKPLIYLVDDDEDDQYLVRKALLHIDVLTELQCFLNGRDCLQELFFQLCQGGQDLPDLILLDVNMPKMDGKEVLQKIRKNISLSHIPIVIYTTSSSDIELRDIYARGANSCVSKPGSFNELVNVMRNICNFWLPKSKTISL